MFPSVVAMGFDVCRFLAAKAHLPVAVRLSATGRPRQDPLAAVLPAALAECRTPACPTSPPQPTSPSWESRGKSRTHQGGLSRAEQGGEFQAAPGDSVMQGCGGSATKPSTMHEVISASPVEVARGGCHDSTSCSATCGHAEVQACNCHCQCEAAPMEEPQPLARSRAGAAAHRLEAMLLEQIGIACSRV